MKILSAQQIREADHYTIQQEPIASEALMERAAMVFADWFAENFSHKHPVKIFCGIGNNGGDGLAVARLLHHLKYQVEVFVVRYSPTPSKDFLFNEKRMKKLLVKITDIHAGDKFPVIKPNEIIIDGLWGSGLNRPIEGYASDLIQHLNISPAIKVAIDIPSGLFADTKSDSVKFNAHYTLTFELPKLAFFFAENQNTVGEWEVKSIGLHPVYLQAAKTDNYFLTRDFIGQLIRPRKKFDHKGTYGHALIISGSYGKMGAAILCAESCLRAGAGLVTAYIPKCGYEILQSSFPEAMALTDKQKDYLSAVPDLSPYKAIGVGPGIGTKAATAKALLQLIKKSSVPLVLDADALNLFSENKKLLKQLPANSILTPHPKEFERLFGKSKNEFERHQLQKDVAKKYKVIIVLKGAYTAIASPDGNIHFNSTGNTGMATAGAGDVLTGIITGLLSQGYSPLNSALLGVYLHGLAGDIAAEQLSQPALIASDITNHLGAAFKSLSQTSN